MGSKMKRGEGQITCHVYQHPKGFGLYPKGCGEPPWVCEQRKHDPRGHAHQAPSASHPTPSTQRHLLYPGRVTFQLKLTLNHFLMKSECVCVWGG